MVRTTVVGSYPVPAWLRVYSTRDSLRDALLAVIKTQELAGIDVVADGELYRWDVNHAETNGMIDYFVRPLDGVRMKLTREELEEWRRQDGQGFRSAPPGVVTSALGHGTLDLRGDYERFRTLTDRPRKFTVTSPYMLAKTLVDRHYGDRRELVLALADILQQQLVDIDAEVVQVDEANVSGHPHDGPLAAEGINRVLSGVRGEKGVHLCFGNYGGQTIQLGEYRLLVDFLNRLEADHLILEVARRPAHELQLLRDVKPELGIGVGVIDIKDNEVESAEKVARRIEQAMHVLGPERVRYVHPDCGFWMLPRSVADGKIAALVRGRDLYLGLETRPPSRA